MPFKKGHKLSTWRPKRSLIKVTQNRMNLFTILLYNQDELKENWVTLEPITELEIRCRLAPSIFQKSNSKVDITNQKTHWVNQKIIRINGYESEVE